MVSRGRLLARTRAYYARKQPSKLSSGKVFLIVTEGEKTEPNYFRALLKRLKLKTSEVVIEHPKATDPVTLTKEAMGLRDHRKREAKKNNFIVEFDEVWVVFDLEKTHDQRRQLAVQAKSLKGVGGIKFASSDPSFEFWLLLHHECTTSPFPDCGAVIKRLKKHVPNYCKSDPLEPFIEKIPKAVRNAEFCRKHHQNGGGDGNPCTAIDLVVKSLNEAAQKYSQFTLS